MKRIGVIQNMSGGIADTPKSGTANTFAFARAINFRDNASQVTVNPKSIRQAGSLISDLPMWGELALTQKYFYGDTGNIYEEDGSGNWSIGQMAPASHGNGLVYFPEDGYLYYAQDKTIGRRSSATGTGTYYNGFLESEGGEPTNTYSVLFASASSQYASCNDVASLSITNDIAMEAYLKLTTLPSAGTVQTIMSKWLEQGNQRSYKFDITTSSNFFGDGSDGALTISADTTQAPIDSACSGTIGTYALTATNAGFIAGQQILIIQMQGTNVGQSQKTSIQAYTAGTITTTDALTFTSSSSGSNTAQVIVLPQYTNVTVNAGKTWTAKAWNGTVGGILAFLASGTVTINGTISAVGSDGLYVGPSDSPGTNVNRTPRLGFGGGECIEQTANPPTAAYAYRGEGTGGGRSTQQNTANGNGGGGGGFSGGSTTDYGAGGIGRAEGGGGGNGTAGGNGASIGIGSVGGVGGVVSSSSDLTTMTMGGGGGGSSGASGSEQASGGSGGGIIFISGATFTMGATGSINANGGAGGSGFNAWSGGGGAGGSVLIKCQTGTLGTNKITAQGGVGLASGGIGGAGVVAVYYSSTITGTSTPTLNSVLDSTLSNVSGYALRLLISSNGTNSEIYSQNITDVIQTGAWARYQVSWDAATSTASFYQNATLLGTKTGALTAIFDSTAKFAIGASFNGSGNAQDFLNGRMDDVRLWNSERTLALFQYYTDRVLTGVETNLSGYWKLDNNFNDSQTYTTVNNLTGSGSPTFNTDVGFSGVTTRADQDVLINASGSTYTLGTTLSEAATDRQTFQPTKEPVKSLMLNINTVGTGNWTVVVHDALNRVVATKTVLNADLHTSFYEFVFSSSFRPVLTANYHVHVYDTTGDGKIVTSSLNDMEGTTGDTGAYLATFFQILVEDIYHPMKQFLNFIAIGNERYVAKLEAGNIYNPHQITLPAGYRVRCLSIWNEYLAIGVWKGTSITDTDQGKIFLWDGSSDVSGSSTVNSIIDVLQGGVNAMEGSGGQLYAIAGYKGKLLTFSGYYNGGQTLKVTQLPLLGQNEYTEVAPGAMCTWQSLLRFGSSINTDSEVTHKGVYSYGKLNFNYPNSLGFDYPLSIGDQTASSVKVGCVFPAGSDLYIGWQNGNTFGIDKVSVTNDPYDTATFELLIADLGRLTQIKWPLVFRCDFEPLVSGQSVTPKYKADREASWKILETEDTVGAGEVRGIINEGVKEVQLAIDIVTNGSQVTIINSAIEVEDFASARGV